MNFHLLIDHWFVDDFIETAEAVDPDHNVFVLVSDAQPRHVKSSAITKAPLGSPELDGIFGRLQTGDRVYVHWFEPTFMPYVSKMPEQVPLYLVFWGGDFFSQTIEFHDFNHDPLTRRYLRDVAKKESPRLSQPVLFLANKIKEIQTMRIKRAWRATQTRVRKEFLARLNYFCHWNYRDLEIVVKTYGGNPGFLHFYYGGGLEQIPGPVFDRPRDNRLHVWLGNSDTTTNNHLDAMQLLTRFKNENIRITCPLSYGKNDYGDFIAKRGVDLFGDKWKSMTQMLPLNEYLDAQQAADVSIMNHNRSQASGNIIAFVKMGKKVYLKRKSTIFQLFEEKGIKIFDVDTLNNISFEEFSAPLTRNEAMENSRIVADLFSVEGKVKGFQRILTS